MATGRRRARRLERVDRDADGPTCLEREPVDPDRTEPSAPTMAVVWMSFSGSLMDSLPRRTRRVGSPISRFYLPAVQLPKVALTGQGGRGHHKTWPLRVISRQAGGDLSLTCRVSGLDLACSGSAWLGSGGWAQVSVARCRRPRGRLASVFLGVRFGSARRGFADLETRQRRKSFVGSNPTASVFFREKTQRASEGGRPDRRSEHRRMKRAVISERGPPTLVSRGTLGLPEGRVIRRTPSEIGMRRS